MAQETKTAKNASTAMARVKYGAIFAVLLGIEILIALFAKGFVRSYIGDLLVIPTLYFLLRVIFAKDTIFSVYVLPFLCYECGWLAEVLQAFHVTKALHIESSSVLGIVLGGSFDLLDGFFYFLGLLLIGVILAVETHWKTDRRWFYPIAVFLQWTWGNAQTMVGFIVYLWYFRCRHEYYKGVVRTVWPLDAGVSLGMFIFTPKEPDPKDQSEWAKMDRAYCEEVAIHEYGHTFQSLLLGPFYFLLVGIPSVMWAGLPRCKRLRKEKHIPYTKFYCEKWASHWGEKVTKEKADWH
ncbi:MAG: DUF2809 domain-containing protein [Clostridiales bacterium]|nr:DUF2809 domain-containing protein [Clostridiales bacterium]